MRFNYKSYPVQPPHRAFPLDSFLWHPILPVRLNNPNKHLTTAAFEAWVDSGSPYCYFHADIGNALGLKLDKGSESYLGGIIAGPQSKAYFHSVGIFVGAELIKIKAGFCDSMSVAGILGRNGFFDNFVVSFDQSTIPPSFELRRIQEQ